MESYKCLHFALLEGIVTGYFFLGHNRWWDLFQDKIHNGSVFVGMHENQSKVISNLPLNVGCFHIPKTHFNPSTTWDQTTQNKAWEGSQPTI